MNKPTPDECQLRILHEREENRKVMAGWKLAFDEMKADRNMLRQAFERFANVIPCDNPDFNRQIIEDSLGYAILEKIRKHAIGQLPGYEKASWGYERGRKVVLA